MGIAYVERDDDALSMCSARRPIRAQTAGCCRWSLIEVLVLFIAEWARV